MSDPNGAPPSRTSRSDQVQRRWRTQGVIVVVVVAAILLAIVVTRSGEDGQQPSPTPSVSGSPAVATERADLLALSVTGAPNALLATIGSVGGLPTAALVLPPEMTVTMPGAGEVTTEALQDLPGASMRVGVSNVDGAWNAQYAVIELDRFGAIVDRLGGLSVDLEDAYTVGATLVGPGTTQLSGQQTVALLNENADDTGARWASVLSAFLAAKPTLSPTDLADTDDPQTAAQVLGAGGAHVEMAPTQVVGGSLLIPAQPSFDDLMSQIFGTPVPLRVDVLNGNGEPGVGEAVGAQLIPAGFRVVLSENADTFDHQTTDIVADGTENEQAAQTAKDALGVGKVIVSSIASGLADVTVTVGSDYHP
jgi:hypothetical protein